VKQIQKGRRPETDLKKREKTKINCLRFLPCLQVTVGAERKRGGGCYGPPLFSRRRMGSRATNGGARGGDAPPHPRCPEIFQPPFLQLQRAFPAILVDFGGFVL